MSRVLEVVLRQHLPTVQRGLQVSAVQRPGAETAVTGAAPVQMTVQRTGRDARAGQPLAACVSGRRRVV